VVVKAAERDDRHNEGGEGHREHPHPRADPGQERPDHHRQHHEEQQERTRSDSAHLVPPHLDLVPKLQSSPPLKEQNLFKASFP